MVNYAENEYFRQAMKSGTGPRASGLRLPKMPQLQVCLPICEPQAWVLDASQFDMGMGRNAQTWVWERC